MGGRGGWAAAPGGTEGREGRGPALSGVSCPRPHGGVARVLGGGRRPHCPMPPVIHPCPAEAVASSPIGLGVSTAPPRASSSVVLWQDRRGESRQEMLGFGKAPRLTVALRQAPPSPLVKQGGTFGEPVIRQNNAT